MLVIVLCSVPWQVCFLLVIAGITMVVTTMYIYVVPFLYATQHPVFFACYFTYGHYLLVMICFNYFCGVYTDPGTAPKVCVRHQTGKRNASYAVLWSCSNC